MNIRRLQKFKNIINILFSSIVLCTSSFCDTKKCRVPSKWLPQAENICYGTKNNDFASFRINQNCHLYAVRLSHVSGSVTCATGYKPSAYSRWGCKYDCCGQKNCLCFQTLLIDQQNLPGRVLLPKIHDAYGRYQHDGFHVNDDVIHFKKDMNLTQGYELQVWYGSDWTNDQEDDNDGRHCIDVDISCWE